MPNTAYFGADTPQAHISGSVVDKDVVIPQAPAGLRADGPRVTFNFTGEWNADNSYVYYDVVKDNSGASWIAKSPVVPKGTSLEEGTYWTRWADPNIEVEELYKTVQEFDARINNNANAIVEETTRAKKAEMELDTKYCLLFGDSWTADANGNPVPNENDSWIRKTVSGLGCTDYKIYARAGARLSSSNNVSDFGNQVISALNDWPASKTSLVEYIIVFGGVNDYQDTSISATDFFNGTRANMFKLCERFNSTKIIFIPLNMFWWRTGYTNNPQEQPTKTIDGGRFFSLMANSVNISQSMNSNITVLPNFASWFRARGRSYYRPNDDSSFTSGGGTYHPNNAGNNLIKQFILDSINGNTSSIPVSFTAKNDFIIKYQSSFADGAYVHWHIIVRLPSSLEAGFHTVGIANFANYEMCLCDLGGDNSGNHLIGQGTTPSYIDSEILFYVADITKNPDGQLLFFNSKQITGTHDISLTATTKIMTY